MKYRLKKKITTFVAIELPEEIRTRLVMVQKELAELKYPVIWELPEKLHITLVYLGKITEEEIQVAVSGLKKLAVGVIRPFELQVGYLSYFFQKHGNGIVWMGVDSGGELEKFYKQAVKDLNKRGFFLSTKKFVGHITLGKLKKMRNDEQKKVLDSLAKQEYSNVDSFVANELTVMASYYRKFMKTTEYEVKEKIRLGN